MRKLVPISADLDDDSAHGRALAGKGATQRVRLPPLQSIVPGRWELPRRQALKAPAKPKKEGPQAMPRLTAAAAQQLLSHGSQQHPFSGGQILNGDRQHTVLLSVADTVEVQRKWEDRNAWAFTGAVQRMRLKVRGELPIPIHGLQVLDQAWHQSNRQCDTGTLASQDLVRRQPTLWCRM